MSDKYSPEYNEYSKRFIEQAQLRDQIKHTTIKDKQVTKYAKSKRLIDITKPKVEHWSKHSTE